MTRAMSQFKDASPSDEREYLPDPVIPLAKRDCRGNKIVSERKRVVKQVEKDPHEFMYEVHK